MNTNYFTICFLIKLIHTKSFSLHLKKENDEAQKMPHHLFFLIINVEFNK